MSFDELQKWDCADEEFGGIYNDGFGCTRVLKKTYSYPPKWNNDNKKNNYRYTKEELQDIWDSYVNGDFEKVQEYFKDD